MYVILSAEVDLERVRRRLTVDDAVRCRAQRVVGGDRRTVLLRVRTCSIVMTRGGTVRRGRDRQTDGRQRCRTRLARHGHVIRFEQRGRRGESA